MCVSAGARATDGKTPRTYSIAQGDTIGTFQWLFDCIDRGQLLSPSADVLYAPVRARCNPLFGVRISTTGFEGDERVAIVELVRAFTAHSCTCTQSIGWRANGAVYRRFSFVVLR